MNTHEFNESHFLRSGLGVHLLGVVLSLVPALVSSANLYILVLLFGEHFGQRFAILVLYVIGLCTLIMQSTRASSAQFVISSIRYAIEIVGRWLIVLCALLAIGFILKVTDPFPRRVLLTWAVSTPAFIVVVGLALNRWIRYLTLGKSNRRRVSIVGCNEAGMSLAMRIKENPQLGMTVEGFFDDRGTDRLGNAPEVKLLGNLRQLAEYVKENGLHVIFVALPLRNMQRVIDLLEELRDTTASIYYVPDVFVFDLIQSRSVDVQGIPVIALCETPFYGYRGLSKRMIDLVVSIILLAVLSPFLVAIAVAVKITSRGPAIFRQCRYGLDGEKITIYKYRTMTVIEDGPQIQQARRNDPRTTAIGRVLRRYSLDELPQLINVIQGRMSLVGPRPHAVAHNELYRKLIKGYMVRHKVLPGITGLAQINGLRGETKDVHEMEARVHYDLEYLRRWSPLLDIKILCLTVITIFGTDHAY